MIYMLTRGITAKKRRGEYSGKSVRNAKKKKKKERNRRRQNSVKRAESISGNSHHCACNAHSELCEGGARVSKKVTNPLHLGDSLSAEASEGIGGDSLYVAVLLQVTKQNMDHKTHKYLEVNSPFPGKKTADICTLKVRNIRNTCYDPL